MFSRSGCLKFEMGYVDTLSHVSGSADNAEHGNQAARAPWHGERPTQQVSSCRTRPSGLTAIQSLVEYVELTKMMELRSL